MSRRQIYAARVFGWQLDYRPDGGLPLDVREGWARSGPRWHVLRLGRLGVVTLGRLRMPTTAGQVTLNLTVDTTAYDAAMQQLILDLDRISWEQEVRRERNAARRWWLDYMTTTYARYGWDWPGPAKEVRR